MANHCQLSWSCTPPADAEAAKTTGDSSATAFRGSAFLFPLPLAAWPIGSGCRAIARPVCNARRVTALSDSAGLGCSRHAALSASVSSLLDRARRRRCAWRCLPRKGWRCEGASSAPIDLDEAEEIYFAGSAEDAGRSRAVLRFACHRADAVAAATPARRSVLSDSDGDR